MTTSPVPICGESDQRNQEYLKNYSPEKYYRSLISTDVPIIFDVGAHKGETVRFFKEIFPKSYIYSFEPDPDNFRELESFCKRFTTKLGKRQCLAANIGIADSDGILPFYRQSISHLGSLLPINNASKDSLGYAKKAQNQMINISVKTIDSFCDISNIKHIDILKIDVQGYEIGVLTDAQNMLKQTSCCTVEVSLYDFYEKSTPLLQIEQLMRKCGLRIWDISKTSKNPKNFRTDWVELVYRQCH